MRYCHTITTRLEGKPSKTTLVKSKIEVIILKAEKIKRLNCRVSEEEYKSFEKKVEKSKLTKSEFMRKSILEKDIIVIDDIKDIVFQMKAIGTNLNQLTRAVNSGEVENIKELQEMKRELDNVWREVLKALKKVNE